MAKKREEALKKVDPAKEYTAEEAVERIKEAAYVKFDETVDLALNLGVDPKKSDQTVRGSVLLPHGTGKKVKVLVFAKGEKEKEAIDAGADYTGGDDLIEKIKQGWLDFDKAIATPDMMGSVGKIGKILGPRGLMPNPKLGTVTFDVARAVRELKAGKAEFKAEKAGIVHVPVGKVSFSKAALLENIGAVMDSVMKAKPPTSKGTYIKRAFISSTMGVGMRLNASKLTAK